MYPANSEGHHLIPEVNLPKDRTVCHFLFFSFFIACTKNQKYFDSLPTAKQKKKKKKKKEKKERRKNKRKNKDSRGIRFPTFNVTKKIPFSEKGIVDLTF